MEYKPAIVVIAYNRAESLKRLLDSLANADYPEKDISLIISIDYHPNNRDVIDVANEFEWVNGIKIVQTHDEKKGLRQHVLECGDYVFDYQAIIMLEDDLVVSRDYYYFAQAAQNFYTDENNIGGVSLYSNELNNFSRHVFRPLRTQYDVYFRQVCESWGQSWTERQWKGFREWLNKNITIGYGTDMPQEIYNWPETSWGKYFSKYVVESNLFLVIPYIARSTCFSEVGQHTNSKDVSNQVCLQNGIPEKYVFPDFSKGVHYDIFFENMDLQPYLYEWCGEEKCRIDINGLHPNGNERYTLSTLSKPYKIVHGFALEMKPPEQNIIFNIQGKDILLYDTTEHARAPQIKFEMNDYDLSVYRKKEISKYIKKTCCNKLFNKLKHG